MKKTGIVLAFVLFFGMIAVVPDSSSAAEFPGMGEIFSTVHLPDYSFSKFMDGLNSLFSSEMIGKNTDLINGMISEITSNTFLSPEYSGGLTGTYVNLYFVICIILAFTCVVGGIVGYVYYKKEQ